MTTQSEKIETRPSLAYSDETRERARNKQAFIAVSLDGNGRSGIRRVTALRRYIKEHPDIVYSMNWRLTGTREAVFAALRQAKIDEDAINHPETENFMVTADNINEPHIKEMIDAEIEASKFEDRSYNTTYDLDDLLIISKSMSTMTTFVPIDPEKQSKNKGKRAAARRTPAQKESLLQRAERAKESSKALDVTNLNESGTGARALPIPSKDANTKFYFEPFSISSSKEEGIRLFFQQANLPEEELKKALASFNEFTNSRTKVRRPAASNKKTNGVVKAPALLRDAGNKGTQVNVPPAQGSVPPAQETTKAPAQKTITRTRRGVPRAQRK